MTEAIRMQCRQWFAHNAQQCIDDARAGHVKVNDLTAYVSWQTQLAIESLTGKNDHTFTFLQRAHFMQTGVTIGLLENFK